MSLRSSRKSESMPEKMAFNDVLKAGLVKRVGTLKTGRYVLK